jgi:hypothetical protein
MRPSMEITAAAVRLFSRAVEIEVEIRGSKTA